MKGYTNKDLFSIVLASVSSSEFLSGMQSVFISLKRQQVKRVLKHPGFTITLPKEIIINFFKK